MNRSWLAGVLGLVLASGTVFTSVPVLAAEPMPANFVPPEQRNAAIRYLLAVTVLTPEKYDKVRVLDWNQIGDNTDPDKMPDAFQEAARVDFGFVLNFVEDGSRMSRCNFESNYEAGIGTLLPQLGQMRQLARILRFDARKQLTLGNADGAADRLLTILRFGNHMKGDGWFISVLVGVAIDNLAFIEVPLVASSPALSIEKRQQLLAELRKNAIPDPLHYAGAVSTERLSIIHGLQKETQTPGAAKRIAAQLSEEPYSAKIAAMTDEQIQREVESLGAMYDQFALALLSQTSDEEAAKIQERIQSGELGTLAAIMMPGADGLRRSESRYKADLNRAIAVVEESVAK
jgi:hypothetical protein